MKLVSINIVNWNGLQLIGECIDSIKLQTYKNIEINIIDNNSTDGSVDFLAIKYPEIRIKINTKNEGFSRAHNQAIKISFGEYIIPLNFDIVLTPTFVEEMVKAVESSPRIGIVSGKLRVLKNGEKTNIIDSTGITMQGMFSADRGQNEIDSNQYAKVEDVFGASGAAPLFRREMLEDIRLNEEYFDEDFYIYVEDVDLCWRAQLYGWKALYTPHAIAYHHRGATRKDSTDIKKEYLVVGYRNRYWAIVKNITLGCILKNLLWIFLGEVSCWLSLVLQRKFYLFKVPFIVLKGVPMMLRKRAMIQKKRKVTSSYMDRFFFANMGHFLKAKFLKKFFRLTNKRLNVLECKTLPLVMKSKPILVYAEAVAACNMYCTMCGRQFHEIRAEDEGIMKLEIFKKAAEILSPGTSLSLFGRGETLMHPKYTKMLRIAKEKGASVGFNTNGKSLTKEKAQKMVEYKQDNLVISFSAGRPETYERIHFGGSYKKLIENIKTLNAFKEEHRSQVPFLAFEFVAMRSNIEELPDLVRLAADLKIANILVIHVTAHNKEMAEREQLRQPKYESITRQMFDQALCEAKQLGVMLILPDHYNPYTKKFSDKKEIEDTKKMLATCLQNDTMVCLESWQTFYVKFNGKVMPCVITNRPMGDLNEQTALDIWNGPLYQKFRERQRSKTKPPECQICHLMPGNKEYNPKLADKLLYEIPL